MFAFFDGDNIGTTLEVLLLEGELQKAVAFSESINIAMKELKDFLEKETNVIVHILGGDDVLIEYDQFIDEDSIIDRIRSIFEKRTGKSMSCGIGNDLDQAIWHLYKAKLFGKDRVYGKQ